jgi:hypothetical protein
MTDTKLFELNLDIEFQILLTRLALAAVPVISFTVLA